MPLFGENHPAKVLCGQPHRGFESLPLRQITAQRSASYGGKVNGPGVLSPRGRLLFGQTMSDKVRRITVVLAAGNVTANVTAGGGR